MHLGKATWALVAEVIFEPILLSFVLLLVFTRMQNVFDYWLTDPQSDLWSAVEANMSPLLWGIFLTMMVFWVIVKLARFTQEDKRSEKLKSEITTIIETRLTANNQEIVKKLEEIIEVLKNVR